MQPFSTVTSRVTILPIDNIDTDQIIPARYLKITDKNGLGEKLFADWRYREDGSPNPDFALNKEENRGAQILLAGANFGCGSSREHAPWALVGYGFRVVISTGYADIFRNNSLKNGLLPVALSADDYQSLLAEISQDHAAELTIDLDEQVVVAQSGKTYSFQIEPFSKACLLAGTDELGYLLKMDGLISAYENRRTLAERTFKGAAA
jgi:3-isopropylmalate/(R)-2-methylmalate dehydratase small subunit